MESISPVWKLFLEGLTQAQAQTYSGTCNSNIANEAPSGYWYSSTSMTSEMCMCSCRKYGFIYAAIDPS